MPAASSASGPPPPPSPPPRRALVAFDFDHTIVDGNTDTHILRTLPDGRLPDDVAGSYQPGRWTEYMGRVLSHLHGRGVTPAQLQHTLQQLPLTAGMRELFQFLAERPHTDVVIISDSNSLFIGWVLAAARLPGSVHAVFTNPAEADAATGLLTVAPMHRHGCAHCPVNMCKTEALQQFLAERAGQGCGYGAVAYVGDGGNDVCPVTRLPGLDLAFARAGFALEAKLQAVAGQLGCEVHVWQSGVEIKDVLQRQWRSDGASGSPVTTQ